MKIPASLLLICIVSDLAQGAQIVRGPEDVVAHRSGNATFACVFDAIPSIGQRLWVTPRFDYVDETTIASQSANYAITFDNASRTYTLTITNVGFRDEGTYECQAASVGFRSATLSIYVTPNVTMYAPTGGRGLVEGEQFNLTCAALGTYPVASIGWLIASNDMPSNVTTVATASRPLKRNDGLLDVISYLTFLPIRGDGGKVVTCQVYALRSYQVSASVKLAPVLYAPNVSATSLPDLGSIYDGSEVTISCSADSHPPVTSWQWYVNEEELPYANNQSSITFPAMSTAYSGQKISCTATNAVGNGSWSGQFMFRAGAHALAAPEDVEFERGNSGLLFCGVDARPPLVIRWLKDGVVISSGCNLTLPDFSEASAGAYICMASVGGGNHTVIRSLKARLREQEAPWLWAVIGVGSGVAVILVIFAAVCCIKRRSTSKKSEGSSSIMSGTTDNSMQKHINGVYIEDGSPACDGQSSAGTSWQHTSDCNVDAFSRLEFLPEQVKSFPGGGDSAGNTDLCFQDALVYPTFTNNYLQFPECYKATVHMRAIPPPPPFSFYTPTDGSIVLGDPTPSGSDSSSITTAALSAPAADSCRAQSAVGFPLSAGTMHSVRQYAVSAVTECQLATNV